MTEVPATLSTRHSKQANHYQDTGVLLGKLVINPMLLRHYFMIDVITGESHKMNYYGNTLG